MTENVVAAPQKPVDFNRYQVGPGLGLIILGGTYLIWYLMPYSLDYLKQVPLGIHNWAYSMIFLTVGLAWYQKSVVTRAIVAIQAFMMPVIGSGSVDPVIIVAITWSLALAWLIVTLMERKLGRFFLEGRLQKRTWLWLNLHLLIVAYLLIAHMGFTFLVQRAPQTPGLLQLGPYAGWLQNYDPENTEISTWIVDIMIILWAVVAIYETFKMGYNLQNKPWPRASFWVAIAIIGAGLIGLLIQQYTIGFANIN